MSNGTIMNPEATPSPISSDVAVDRVENSASSCGTKRLAYGTILAVLFLLLTWPAILSGSKGRDTTGAAFDQNEYHYPVIQKMTGDWPHPDLVNLGGIQMTPTFHLLMAALAHYCHFDLTGIRLAASLAGLLLMISVYWFTVKWVEPRAAFAMSISYLFSPFMLSASIWLMTDNFGWLFVSLALGWVSFYPATPRRVLGSGVAAAAATAFRQIQLWLIAPIAVAGLVRIMPERFQALALSDRESTRQPGPLLASIFVAVVLPVLVILFFVSLWHGLIPPGSAQRWGTNNHFKIVPLALAQAGFCSLFLLPTVLDRSTFKTRLCDWRVWTGAAICFLLAAFPRSAEQQNPGGAMVSLSGHTPVMFHRVLILLPPAAFAGAALVIFFLAARERGRGREAFLLLFGFVCWLTAQTTPVYIYRRYCDFIQVMIIWLAALGLPFAPRRGGFWIGPIALSLVQCGLSFIQVYLPVFRG
jgi:hypothetical protein